MMGVGPETGKGRAADDPTCGPRSHLIKTAGEGPKGLTIHGQETDFARWTMVRINMILYGCAAAGVQRDDTLAPCCAWLGRYVPSSSTSPSAIPSSPLGVVERAQS